MSDDDESMMLPMVMAAGIVLFLMYVCCGPGSTPDPAGRERPHSMGSTRRNMADNEKSE